MSPLSVDRRGWSPPEKGVMRIVVVFLLLVVWILQEPLMRHRRSALIGCFLSVLGLSYGALPLTAPHAHSRTRRPCPNLLDR